MVMMQVRSLAELLPQLDVVADDPFNSSPTDASLMGQDALARARAGKDLPVAQAPTPLVGSSCTQTSSPRFSQAEPFCFRFVTQCLHLCR